MNRKIFALTAFLLVFSILYTTVAYAVDVSINSVKVNGEAFAEGKTNFIQDTDNLDVVVSLTAIKDLSNIHVNAILTDLNTGNTVADSSNTFILDANQNTLVALNLRLIDNLKRQKDFRLEISVVDLKGNKEQESFGLKFTGTKAGAGKLDVSIDRVRVNDRIVAQSTKNFIDRSNDFDVIVEFTALNDLKNAHVEAILKDLKSGTVVADASPNFDLAQDSSSSNVLMLGLLDKQKQSDSFELTVKIVDADGNSIQKVYGIETRARNTVSGAGGRALDVSIDSIELENKVLAENENNFVVIDNLKKKMNLKVRLTSLENVQDAHVDAVLAFENGDVVADSTTAFDISNGQNLIKDLDIPVIGKFEQNSFKLKVRVVDAEGNVEEKSYGLKISQSQFPFVISSIALSPEDNAEAGKNLIARLNFKNSGVVPLEGVTAKVSIPELGVSSTRFIDQIKSKGAEASEEFILKILDNAATGTYTVRAEITSQFGDTETKETPVFILGKGDQIQQVINDRLVITVPILSQDMSNDGSEVIYPITLRNDGPDADTYTLMLDGANWADLRLIESNTFIIKPKESKTIHVYASSKGNLMGEQTFVVTIKSNDKVLKQIPLKGNVVGAAKSALAAALKNALEIMLILFVVFLAGIGFFFGIRKYMQGNSGISEEIPDEEQGEAYY